jgi:hypothetical protein
MSTNSSTNEHVRAWSCIRADVDTIAAAGVDTADVTILAPAGSGAAAFERLSLIEEGDRMAHDGALLCPPALPEILACRRWLLGPARPARRGRGPATMAAAQPPQRPARPRRSRSSSAGGSRSSPSGRGAARPTACQHRPTRTPRSAPRRLRPLPHHRRAPPHRPAGHRPRPAQRRHPHRHHARTRRARPRHRPHRLPRHHHLTNLGTPRGVTHRPAACSDLPLPVDAASPKDRNDGFRARRAVVAREQRERAKEQHNEERCFAAASAAALRCWRSSPRPRTSSAKPR